jgi:hypothetical protein
MGRSKEQALADHITRQVLDNRNRRTRNVIQDAREEFFKMANSPSCTTSGMSVNSSNVVVARRPAPLEAPAEQQAHAGDVRTGSTKTDTYRATPNQNSLPYTPADSRGVDGLATDATAVPDMPLGAEVKRRSYTQLEGKGSGPSTVTSVKDSVTATLDKLANDCDPRCQMKGQQNSKFYQEDGKSFKSTPTGLDSDAGN